MAATTRYVSAALLFHRLVRVRRAAARLILAPARIARFLSHKPSTSALTRARRGKQQRKALRVYRNKAISVAASSSNEKKRKNQRLKSGSRAGESWQAMATSKKSASAASISARTMMVGRRKISENNGVTLSMAAEERMAAKALRVTLADAPKASLHSRCNAPAPHRCARAAFSNGATMRRRAQWRVA